MMQHQYIFLNGPPGCGKDLAARFIMREFAARHMKLAAPMKAAMSTLFSLTHEEFRELESGDNAQIIKNNPQPRFNGMSWRELLIWFSEDCLKPQFGANIFGKLAVNSLRAATGAQLTVFSDCGFAEEVSEVARVFGTMNCHILTIERDGHTFDGDSRSYITRRSLDVLHPSNVHIRIYPIANTLEKLMYRLQILMCVGKIMNIDRDW